MGWVKDKGGSNKFQLGGQTPVAPRVPGVMPQAPMYKEGGKVEKKPRRKKGSKLIQNDALKSIQDAHAKLNQDKTDGKFGSSAGGDWDQAGFKAAEKTIGDRLKAHRSNSKNWS